MDFLTEQKFSFISKYYNEKDMFGVVEFKGSEAISECYRFEIQVISDNQDIDPLHVLQNPACFTIHRDEGEDVIFNGILVQFEETQEFNGYLFFKAVLAPKFSWLNYTHHNQVFLDLSIPEIIEQALKDGGLNPGVDFELKLQMEYKRLEYVCQYDESHFNFVSRWAEREGIYYYFEQNQNTEKIIFTDTRIAHTDLAYSKDLFYSPQSGLDSLHTKEVIKTFKCNHNLLPKRVYLKDYNFMKPSLAIEAVADVDENGRGENYIYGLNFETPEEGKRLATIRAEELKCKKSLFGGQSSVPFIVPGYTFDLKDHFKPVYNRKYLITKATHEGHQTGYFISGLSSFVAARDEKMFYANNFTAIYSDEQFRPEQNAFKTKISGTINAKIDAASSGKYAELDDIGRYKVILPFDRSGRFGGKASAWFRMMQPYAGQNQGMHFPLHKGTEVLLTFIDGDPDRPLIAGAVPNPETSSPVTSGNQTKSIIATGKNRPDSSAGAAQASFDVKKAIKKATDYIKNYLEFEDFSGSERIRIHSDGDIWQEAQNRYADYQTGVPSPDETRPPHIADLIDKMYVHSSSGFGPTGVKLYSDSEPYSDDSGFPSSIAEDDDAEKWKYLVDRGQVTIAKGDTFNTQEGNIYDFGGYWNYNLGNCYVEEHLDQAAELNKTRDNDLLDQGGPGWTEVDWSKAQTPDSDDIKIDKIIDWKNEEKGVWVEKKFGHAYTYAEGDTIDITTGSSLDIQHGGRHVELAYRGDGTIKSWSWSEKGVSKEKKWASSGTKVYESESNSSEGTSSETKWNKFSGKKVYHGTSNIKSGITSEWKYCQDTGRKLSYSSSHQGFDSVHSYNYNWANTASASVCLAAGASFSFNLSEQGAIDIYAAAKETLHLGVGFDLDVAAYLGGKFALETINGLFFKGNFSPYSISLGIDLPLLNIDLGLEGATCKVFGVEMGKKTAKFELTDINGKVHSAVQLKV